MGEMHQYGQSTPGARDRTCDRMAARAEDPRRDAITAIKFETAQTSFDAGEVLPPRSATGLDS